MHTHTHTHIYIHIYMEVNKVKEPKNRIKN